ncbi:MAG TPA: nuclear transport factor 2 family protein [Polyangiaceae bacterium]|nr:nuclear transport factor 2 family protein [Polyangiaceae bacterium]
MEDLRRRLDEFIGLVESGRSIDAMQRFYAEDVMMFENRELSRAGRDACIAFEREQLAKTGKPHLKATKRAADPQTGVSFIEWVVQFRSPSSGRPIRLEEVAVQKWSNGEIIEERFYYEGVIDQGDEDDEADDDVTV